MLLHDARLAGVLDAVEPVLRPQLSRERYVSDVFAAKGPLGKLRCFAGASNVPLSTRMRMLVYAAWPGLLWPWFWLRRQVKGRFKSRSAA